MRGWPERRLAGIEMLSYSSGPTLGNVEAGVLEALAGLRTSIVAGGALSIVGTVVMSALLPAFWRYDSRQGERLRHGSIAGTAATSGPGPAILGPGGTAKQ